MFEKGELLYEGKTKKVYEVKDNPDHVILENKEDITAFDDKKYTKKFKTKAKYATTTTCQVFKLLSKAGIPVAFVQQFSSTEFFARKCQMISLEVVARRYAVGSYLKRHPELEKKKGEIPHRFHRVKVEFFLKTTGGQLRGNDDNILVSGLNAEKGEEDPIILNPHNKVWELRHPKKPTWDPESILSQDVFAEKVVSNINHITKMEEITRRIFMVIEKMWAILGHRFIDMKIEFGIDFLGNLLVADVIDNDSWRLRNMNWEELSKEAFRQGEELSEVERKYEIVAVLTEQFRLPVQVLVVWMGSEKDEPPKTEGIPVQVDIVVLSGHKATRKFLNRLEEIMAVYPDGGVIIYKIGMSNGAAPVGATHTTWPVITVPASIDKFPNDIWSSLRMPSNVPLATICSDVNAVDFALNILAQKNPIIYMQRQFAIEELDN